MTQANYDALVVRVNLKKKKTNMHQFIEDAFYIVSLALAVLIRMNTNICDLGMKKQSSYYRTSFACVNRNNIVSHNSRTKIYPKFSRCSVNQTSFQASYIAQQNLIRVKSPKVGAKALKNICITKIGVLGSKTTIFGYQTKINIFIQS